MCFLKACDEKRKSVGFFGSVLSGAPNERNPFSFWWRTTGITKDNKGDFFLESRITKDNNGNFFRIY